MINIWSTPWLWCPSFTNFTFYIKNKITKKLKKKVGEFDGDVRAKYTHHISWSWRSCESCVIAIYIPCAARYYVKYSAHITARTKIIFKRIGHICISRYGLFLVFISEVTNFLIKLFLFVFANLDWTFVLFLGR